MNTETVKLRIVIEISTDGEVDTGLAVAEWNALTDEERSEIYHNLWDEEAGNADNGGGSVITPGAAGI